jgi:hypothetical protein
MYTKPSKPIPVGALKRGERFLLCDDPQALAVVYAKTDARFYTGIHDGQLVVGRATADTPVWRLPPTPAPPTA